MSNIKLVEGDLVDVYEKYSYDISVYQIIKVTPKQYQIIKLKPKIISQTYNIDSSESLTLKYIPNEFYTDSDNKYIIKKIKKENVEKYDGRTIDKWIDNR